MRQVRPRCQQQLFEGPPVVPAVGFPPDVQDQLRQALVQWLRAAAKGMRQEGGDEQDHR